MRGKRSKKAASPVSSQDEAVKEAKPVGKLAKGPLRALRQMVTSPDFGYQALVILLSLTHGNFPMERRINTMATSLDSLRNMTGVLENAMQSLKTAADAPKQIRQMLKQGPGKS